ncbi:MAG: hypothetical protein K2J18_08950 [Paramuribaculum sp.]|nr:hypothetical protein [Paramuribaculum sp.]
MSDYQPTNTDQHDHFGFAGKELSESGRALLVMLAAAALLLTAFLTSCHSADGVEEDLRLAEMSLAEGDMASAHSIADRLTDGKNMSGLSAKQLARLSLVYIQLADGEENNDLAVNATELYRLANNANSDSVADYFQSLSSAEENYATLLHHLVSASDAQYSFDEGTGDTDSITETKLPKQ